MGDAPQFWAEGATRITLPNSRLRIGYATGYHDWQSGCSMSQIFVCHLPNQWLGVAAGDLTPTMPVAWSLADFLEGTDTALEKIKPLWGANLPEHTYDAVERDQCLKNARCAPNAKQRELATGELQRGIARP